MSDCPSLFSFPPSDCLHFLLNPVSRSLTIKPRLKRRQSRCARKIRTRALNRNSLLASELRCHPASGLKCPNVPSLSLSLSSWPSAGAERRGRRIDSSCPLRIKQLSAVEQIGDCCLQGLSSRGNLGGAGRRSREHARQKTTAQPATD